MLDSASSNQRRESIIKPGRVKSLSNTELFDLRNNSGSDKDGDLTFLLQIALCGKDSSNKWNITYDRNFGNRYTGSLRNKAGDDNRIAAFDQHLTLSSPGSYARLA